MKLALVVEYNGKRYHGFEWQRGVPTIQDELERAIERVTGEKRRVIPASRTDAGVHATGQVVSLWTESTLDTTTVLRALNYYLPGDIVVKAAHRIGDDFSVRGDAVSREYRYSILNRSVRSPMASDFTYFVPGRLDTDRMNEAGRFLIGQHDFISFATEWEGDRKTVHTVHVAEVVRCEDIVEFWIKADAFLPHQVRNTAGMLVRVGLGRTGPAELKEVMEARRPGLAGPTAPAQGLCLVRIEYRRPLGE